MNGISYWNSTYETSVFPERNFYIFAGNHSGYFYYASQKVYSAQMYDPDNVLIRDFIPVVDWNDIPCLYDKVSGTLFYNKGSGQFLVPKN